MMDEFELELPAKMRVSGKVEGQLVQLARKSKVRVRVEEDGQTLEIYAEHPMIFSQSTSNVLRIKLRRLDEVE